MAQLVKKYVFASAGGTEKRTPASQSAPAEIVTTPSPNGSDASASQTTAPGPRSRSPLSPPETNAYQLFTSSINLARDSVMARSLASSPVPVSSQFTNS